VVIDSQMDLKIYLVQFYLFSLLLIAFLCNGNSSSNAISSYVGLCNDAKNITLTSSSAYCNVVAWSTASLYSKSQFSVYQYGVPLSVSDQDNVAQVLSSTFKGMSSKTSDACLDSIKWFSCLKTFPFCPIRGSASYLEPCKLQCKHMVDLCGMSGVDCNNYKTENCMIYIPSGYETLPEEKVMYR